MELIKWDDHQMDLLEINYDVLSVKTAFKKCNIKIKRVD
jgi:hypothetical protein